MRGLLQAGRRFKKEAEFFPRSKEVKKILTACYEWGDGIFDDVEEPFIKFAANQSQKPTFLTSLDEKTNMVP